MYKIGIISEYGIAEIMGTFKICRGTAYRWKKIGKISRKHMYRMLRLVEERVYVERLKRIRAEGNK